MNRLLFKNWVGFAARYDKCKQENNDMSKYIRNRAITMAEVLFGLLQKKRNTDEKVTILSNEKDV